MLKILTKLKILQSSLCAGGLNVVTHSNDGKDEVEPVRGWAQCEIIRNAYCFDRRACARVGSMRERVIFLT